MLGLDRKRLHIYHEMFRDDDGPLLATTEQMLLHVDMKASAACPILPAVASALRPIVAAHQTLPIPKQVGRQMAVKKD